MDAMRLGRLSLRLDAAYCAASALLVCGLAPVVAPQIGVTAAVVVVAGVAVGCWAAFLWLAPARMPLRTMLRIVLAVNVLAAAAVGISATALSSLLLSVALIAVSIEVGAFATSQALALKRLT